MRATRALAVVCAVVSSLLAGACGGGAGDAAAGAAPRVAALAPGSIGVWDDALLAGWGDWSWGSTRASTTSVVSSGSAALAVTFQAWGGLYFRHTTGPVSLSGMASLDLYANGGASAGNKLLVWAVQGSTSLPSVSLSQYCAGGSIPAAAWTRCTVPLTALAPAGAAIDGIVLQEVDGAARPAMYFDSVALVPPVPAGVPVYGDALASGWIDWSWGSTRNLAATAPVASGTRSMAVTFQGWGAVYFHRSTGSLSGMSSIDLSVNGGSVAGAPLEVRATQNGTAVGRVNLAPYCAGGTIPANAWTRCSVPLSALVPAGAAIDGFWMQYMSATARAALYLDAVALNGGASPPPPPPPPALPAAPTNLAAAAAPGAVSLSWNTVSGATGYLVSRAAASAGPFTALASSPQAGTTYRDAAVTAGATYWYRVAAVNAAGTGPASATVSAVVPAPTPVTVSIAPATATVDACTRATFRATVSGATDQTVTWSIQEGAAGGTVDATGSYTAPSTAGTYHLVATSRASTTSSASVPVTVRDHILAVVVNPSTQTLAAGATQAFTATVTTTCGSFAAGVQ